MEMIIGFTGTRNGMTNEQRQTVRNLLSSMKADHADAIGCHGDCVGADADFDALCKEFGFTTYCLPCTFDSMRAWCTEPRAERKPPMARNRDIVAQADVMIACPPNAERIKSGSGTWATIGFSEKAGKPLHVVFPDGTIRDRKPNQLLKDLASIGKYFADRAKTDPLPAAKE
jgi:hypothetical protein